MAGIENKIGENIQHGRKCLAILIDPDKYPDEKLQKVLDISVQCGVDFFFCGGSLLMDNRFSEVVHFIKTRSQIPLILFPGNGMQINAEADAILLLSLVSGRNPDYLIGQHVIAAPRLQASGMEVLPVAYLLIEGGRVSTTEYISNTRPIPAAKTDIALCTALAASQLGFRFIYLEAGSGAAYPVPSKMISTLKSNISLPLIVGGGIQQIDQAKIAFQSGADIVVVGNAVENDPEFIQSLCKIRDQVNNP